MIDGAAVVLSGTETDTSLTNVFSRNRIDGVTGSVYRAINSYYDQWNSNIIGGINKENVHYINDDVFYLDHVKGATISDNIITGFKVEGITLLNSDEIEISKNHIFSEESDFKAINISSGSTMSNLGLLGPDVESFVLLDTATVRVTGTIGLNSGRIEVFLQNKEKKQSLQYVEDIVITQSGDWTLDIPSQFFDYADQWDVVALAIDDDGNTSEFGPSVSVIDLLCEYFTLAGDLVPNEMEFCPGTTLDIEPRVTKLNYEWTSDSLETTVTSRVLTVDKESIYSIKISDNQGCNKVEEVFVLRKDSAALPDFLISTHVFAGDTIAIINRSEVPVDSLTWDLPGATMWESGVDEKIYYVIFPSPDTIKMELTSYNDVCASRMMKDIYILEEGSELPQAMNQQVYSDLELIEFYVTPNPIATGEDFELHYLLNHEASVLMGIYDTEGRSYFQTYLNQEIVPKELVGENYLYKFRVKEIPLPAGVYVIKIGNDQVTSSVKLDVKSIIE